jgi:carbamoylphosphate synthase large subunit
MNLRAHDGTGGVNAPAATDCARVMVVSGNARCARSSQLAAAAGIVPQASNVNEADKNRNLGLQPAIEFLPIQG